MNELHFEHLQRVTAAIGALSAGCAVMWDTENSFTYFVIYFLMHCILTRARIVENCQH
jgi:hypothetical protein